MLIFPTWAPCHLPRRLRSKILARSYASLHPLDLQQELIFWRLTHFSVQEDNLNTCPYELFQQEHLVSVVARQVIGAMHIEVINAQSLRDITQALQGRTNERCPAVAIVHKL
jgi:hypothetical protein